MERASWTRLEPRAWETRVSYKVRTWCQSRDPEMVRPLFSTSNFNLQLVWPRYLRYLPSLFSLTAPVVGGTAASRGLAS